MQQFNFLNVFYASVSAHTRSFEWEKFSNETTRENHIALQPLTEKI